jgi:cytochrome oxidase Cu insertion factor (SCO1/SenC/PrrC family)
MRKGAETLKHQLLIGVIGISLFFGASFAIALEVGDQAPDFELPSTSGEKVSLSQFKGKKHVLLQFYTLEFQPT